MLHASSLCLWNDLNNSLRATCVFVVSGIWWKLTKWYFNKRVNDNRVGRLRSSERKRYMLGTRAGECGFEDSGWRKVETSPSSSFRMHQLFSVLKDLMCEHLSWTSWIQLPSKLYPSGWTGYYKLQMKYFSEEEGTCWVWEFSEVTQIDEDKSKEFETWKCSVGNAEVLVFVTVILKTLVDT